MHDRQKRFGPIAAVACAVAFGVKSFPPPHSIPFPTTSTTQESTGGREEQLLLPAKSTHILFQPPQRHQQAKHVQPRRGSTSHPRVPRQTPRAARQAWVHKSRGPQTWGRAHVLRPRYVVVCVGCLCVRFVVWKKEEAAGLCWVEMIHDTLTRGHCIGIEMCVDAEM